MVGRVDTALTVPAQCNVGHTQVLYVICLCWFLDAVYYTGLHFNISQGQENLALLKHAAKTRTFE